MSYLPGISFIWPAMLLFLGFIPLGILLYIFLQNRRRRITAQLLDSGVSVVSRMLGESAIRSEPGIRRHIPPALFLTSFTILLVALARPQALVRLPRVQGTVILAFDVSGSMAADDLKPSRMESAKDAARNFVERQPTSVQIGVVAFSGNGFAVQMPTNDREVVLASIDRLKPERGTSLAYGILTSLDLIDQQAGKISSPNNELAPTPVPESTYAPAVIILLTDGENTAPPDPFAATLKAAERGVRIYTVGIGSTAGKTMEINGFNVHTRLDERTLQEISHLSGGSYFSAESEEDLPEIFEDIHPQLVIAPERMEITSLLAGAGILMLLIGGAFSLVWFSRLP